MDISYRIASSVYGIEGILVLMSWISELLPG